MGMIAARGLATTVLADPGFLWEVPDNWTLEEAATVPVVYGTVSRQTVYSEPIFTLSL
jgi:fatty acid synthase